jgi:extracellular factor (EF) 3-hydroxypalmitic acid methyl ester biosynthesis protein
MLIRTQPRTEFLTDVHQALLLGAVDPAIEELLDELHAARAGRSTEEWRGFVADCVRHPVKNVLHQDPMTRRCYEKPRGYAGDAVMLDLVYGISPVSAQTTELGREIFRHNYAVPACESVRTRKRMVAELIDRLADDREDFSALSVACGHIREAQASRAVGEGRVRRFVGLDQDPHSLAVVEQELGASGVQPVEGTVKQILQGRLPLGTFDLVYAVGLYAYLIQPVAIALTAKLFQHVAPGGTLLVPNLAPDIREVGYMEAFMDWNMIYRDEEVLEDIACAIDPMDVAERRVYREPGGNVVFLELTRW